MSIISLAAAFMVVAALYFVLRIITCPEPQTRFNWYLTNLRRAKNTFAVACIAFASFTMIFMIITHTPLLSVFLFLGAVMLFAKYHSLLVKGAFNAAQRFDKAGNDYLRNKRRRKRS